MFKYEIIFTEGKSENMNKAHITALSREDALRIFKRDYVGFVVSISLI
jgi:hypothetical protein